MENIYLDLIRDVTEKSIAIEWVLQSVCAAMPRDQAEKALSLLGQIKDHVESLPLKDDDSGIYARALNRMNPFVEILSGLPPKMPLH